MCATAFGGRVIYVDHSAGGAGDGSAWADAIPYLQDALMLAVQGDEIRIARGEYRPDQGNGMTAGDREATFQLKNGVTIRGGYAGSGEPDPGAHDPRLYVTRLSGDLFGNDTGAIDGTQDNSLHVVTLAEGQAVIDGFTITAGRGEPSRFHGSGIYKTGGNLTVSNCVLIRNWAGDGYHGTSIYNTAGTLIALNCIFDGVGFNEGILGYPGSEETIVNCIFLNHYQAAISKYGDGLTIANCLFAYNEWGLFLDYSFPVISNTILWSNNQNLMYDGGAEAVLVNCYDGENPGFVDAGCGDFHLRSDAPCVNAGDNAPIEEYATDLDGNTRIARKVVDIGPYEYAGSVTLCVPGQYSTIQSAIDAAADGDTVLVADGTYTGEGNRDIDFLGKAIAVRSENGPETCTVDCQGSAETPHRGFYFHSGESRQAVLEGFSIVNGYQRAGSAILCENDTGPTVCNNIIEHNRTCYDCDGAAVGFRYGAWPLITDNIIRDNDGAAGDISAGALYCANDGPAVIENNRILNNTGQAAGGLYFHNAPSQQERDPVVVRNNLIAGNSAPFGGAIRINIYSTPVYVVNCTIVDNAATYAGAGIEISSWLTPIIHNCILWGNHDPDGSTEASQIRGQFFKPADLPVNYTCVQGWTGRFGGVGNMGDAPQFVDAGAGDYHLRWGSPCINAGDNSVVLEGATDLDGKPRIIREVVDMGCYEAEPPPIVEAELNVYPGVLNRRNTRGIVIAWITLPEGMRAENVAASEPLVLVPGDVKSIRQLIIPGRRHGQTRVSVVGFFKKADVLKAITGTGRVELEVRGSLKDGRVFTGADTIRIIRFRWPWQDLFVVRETPSRRR